MILFLIFLSAYSALCKKFSIPYMLPAGLESRLAKLTNNRFITKVLPRLAMSVYFSVGFMPVHAQTNWTLKKDEDGIKVYTGNMPNTSLKAIRVECLINTTTSKLSTLLMDAAAHEQWVYSTKTSYVVKNINDREHIYYSEISFPWPMKNRDVVVHLKLTEDKGILKVSAVSTPGYVASKNSLVRVPKSVVQWIVTPVNDHQVKVAYTAEADPGESIPAWIVNMFCIKGPFETFRKLRTVLQ